MSKNLIIVFAKNLIPGTVKQRLAVDIGMDLAMEVYKEMLNYTAEVVDKVSAEKAVYYSQYVELYDAFNDETYKKHIQEGNELGQRMLNAFYDSFENDYDKVVLIGTDIPNINKKIIEDAFQKLDDHDVVIGPAEDGGYYLVGMKQDHPSLFTDKEYSHEKVYEDLIDAIEDAGLTFANVQTLFDLDTQADMKKAGIQIVFEEEDEEGLTDEDEMY